MKDLCPYCGSYPAGTYPICDNCYQAGGTLDGSQEMSALAYALKRIRNRRWVEEEFKFVADSAAFIWLCEQALPLVEAKCLRNLLRKVLRDL
jgi:hypothetical protein